MEPLTAELVRIAERMKRRPEQRARFARALREALEVVEPRTPCAGCEAAVSGLMEALTCASEHANFIREVIDRPPR